jgi:hypothetical protein
MTEWSDTPINSKAYGIMILVEVSILFGAMLSDLFSSELFSKDIRINDGGQGNIPLLNIILLLAIIGFLFLLLTTGSVLLRDEKQAIMEELNRSYILFYTATVIGATMSFEYKKWKYFAFFGAFIMFDLFIGFRISLAIAGISIFTLWLSKKGKRRLLIDSWKPLTAGGLVGGFLFFYKEIAFAVRMGDWDLFRSILSDPNTYVVMFNTSEPFVTQSILNEVTLLDFSVDWSHLAGIFYQFILFSPELGLEGKSFNDLFQLALFPDVTYGMANNIWAEMWSAGGWLLLLIFMLVFIGFLEVFSILLASRRASLRSFFAVMGSYWAFYIHRNDLGYELFLLKGVILIMMSSLIVDALIRNLKRMRPAQSTPSK